MKTLIGLLLCVFSIPAFAWSVTLAWDPPTTLSNGEPLTDLAGFYIYYGQTGLNEHKIDVGNVNTYQVLELEDGHRYYFAATAYRDLDGSIIESDFSNRVSVTSAPPIIPGPSTINLTGTFTGTLEQVQ